MVQNFSIEKLKLTIKDSSNKLNNDAWKVSIYGVISGPYVPVFGLNKEIYEEIFVFNPKQENTDQK